MTMAKVSSINQNKVPKTRGALKQFGTNEMAKGKHQSEIAKRLMEDKENTPPVTRSKSRTFKSVNKNNSESVASFKTKEYEKKNESEENFSRTALKPVKEKTVGKSTKNYRMSINVSPIHPPKRVSNSGKYCQVRDLKGLISRDKIKPGRNHISNTLLPVKKRLDDTSLSRTLLPIEESRQGDTSLSRTLLPIEEIKDDNLASLSHIVFRRRSSITIKKEVCMLTWRTPPLLYWKMLAEQRLNAVEKTLHQNELMYDQLSVLEAENSQLKETLKQAEEMIMNFKSAM